MKSLVIVTIFLIGILLIVSYGVLYLPRQNISGAYWIIDVQTIRTHIPYQSVAGRMLPDGQRYSVLAPTETLFNYSQLDFTWIPGRSEILYADCLEEQLTLIRLSIVTEQQTRTPISSSTDQYCFWDATVSPDGKQTLFRIMNGNRSSLFVARPNGEAPVLLADAPFGSGEIAFWSPDSEWIYFNGFRSDDSGLYRIHHDGSGVEHLSDFVSIENPTWSDDGHILTFIHHGIIYEMDSETGETIPISDAEINYTYYRRVGEWIVASADVNTRLVMHRIDPDTSEFLPLVSDIYFRNGIPLVVDKRLLLMQGKWRYTNLFEYQIDSGRSRPLLPLNGDVSPPVLSSDDENIYVVFRIGTNVSV